MKLVDVHCHLESRELFENIDHVIDEAAKAGIVKLITSSVTPSQWDVSRELAEKYKMVEFSAGIHPWFAALSQLNIIEELYRMKDKGAVAIGEIGLDKKIDNPDFETQRIIFTRQLEIAIDINLPVIIHCRGAFDELIHILKEKGAPQAGGIIHSFSGSVEIAEELIKLGLSFSLGGTLTYRNSKKREKLLQRIYPDYMLLETDSPDILPVPLDKKPNMPSNIILNLKAASEILEQDEETVAMKTTANAVKIFNLRI